MRGASRELVADVDRALPATPVRSARLARELARELARRSPPLRAIWLYECDSQGSGGVAERPNAPVLKTGDGVQPRPWVRIPPPPLIAPENPWLSRRWRTAKRFAGTSAPKGWGLSRN